MAAAPPAIFVHFEIERNEWSNTFDVIDDSGMTVAAGSSTGIIEQMRSLIRSQHNITNISLQGHPIGDDESETVDLFQSGERSSIPLPKTPCR